jgi:hypothetical protein
MAQTHGGRAARINRDAHARAFRCRVEIAAATAWAAPRVTEVENDIVVHG